MKTKKKAKKGVEYKISSGGLEFKDALMVPEAETELLRTQVYLTREENEFLQSEANRLGDTKAAVLRGIIDDRMKVPEKGWKSNPLLADPVEDPTFSGHRDGGVNHDEYIYGRASEERHK